MQCQHVTRISDHAVSVRKVLCVYEHYSASSTSDNREGVSLIIRSTYGRVIASTDSTKEVINRKVFERTLKLFERNLYSFCQSYMCKVVVRN